MSAKAQSGHKSLRESRRAERQRRQRMGRLAWGLAGLVLIAVAGYVLFGAVRPKPGQSVPIQGQAHIRVGDPHEPYNSNPPTSGPHAEPVEAGFYDEAPPDENLVHNLEHGYIILWYDCSALDETECQALKTQVRAVMERARPLVMGTDSKKLIAVPRPGMEALIALTSWGRIDKLTRFDEAEIKEFIEVFRNQAPEPGAP